MKKIVMMVILGLVTASYAGVNVNWNAAAGFTWSPTDSALLSSGGSYRAQLMYSPDSIFDGGINTSGAGINNDVVWQFQILTEGIDCGIYGDMYNTYNYQQGLVGGSVYAVVFQDGVLNVNDWYFYTPLLSIADITGATPPQGIQINTDLVLGNSINVGPTVGQVVAIPEPATFLLFGIGGMGAWMVRRNKLKAKQEADA